MAVNSFSSYLSPYIIGASLEALSSKTKLLGACNKDMSTAEGVVGASVSLPIPQVLTTSSFTASNVPSVPTAITGGAQNIVIENDVRSEFALYGADQQNYMLNTFNVEQLKAAVQAVVKQVNQTIWTKSLAINDIYGTAGTGLFASNANGLSAIGKKLTDKYCPDENRMLVCSTRDYAALADTIVNVNTRGSTDVSFTGQFMENVRGFTVLQDTESPVVTKGTITGDPVASATAVGSTTVILTCDSDDAVAIKAGDLITFGDGYNYAAAADLTIGNSSTGVLTLSTQLLAALAGTENPAYVTGYGTSLGVIAGDLSGISIVCRTPAVSAGGVDFLGNHMVVVDQPSGFPVMISTFAMDGLAMMRARALFGIKVTDNRKLVRPMTYAAHA